MQAALEFMEAQRGKHFDPECFDAFRAQIDSIMKIQDMLPDLPAANSQ